MITAFIAYSGLKMALAKFLGGLTFIKNDLMKTGGMYRNSGGKIMGGLKKGGMGLLNGVKNLGVAMGKNVALLGGKALAGVKGLGTLIMGIGPKLLGFGKLLLGGVAKGLALINPFVLIGAAIAGIGLLIYNYWDEITAFFKSIVTKLIEFRAKIMTKIGNFVSDMFAPVFDFFSSIGMAIKNAINAVIDMLPIPEYIKNKLKFNTDAPAKESAEAPTFVKNLQGPTLSDRAEKLKLEKSATQYIVNNNTATNVAQGGNTVQNHATRYVRDQGSVFASNNA